MKIPGTLLYDHMYNLANNYYQIAGCIRAIIYYTVSKVNNNN